MSARLAGCTHRTWERMHGLPAGRSMGLTRGEEGQRQQQLQWMVSEVA
jgi:hypothetical protein